MTTGYSSCILRERVWGPKNHWTYYSPNTQTTHRVAHLKGRGASEPHLPSRHVEKCCLGVPFVAQQLMNPTRIHEDAGSITGLAQWVKDLVLP